MICPVCGIDTDELLLRQAKLDLRAERVDARFAELLSELAETRSLVIALKAAQSRAARIDGTGSNDER